MFLTLLAVTFLIALSVSFIIVRLFGRSITNILERLIEESIVGAWLRYLASWNRMAAPRLLCLRPHRLRHRTVRGVLGEEEVKEAVGEQTGIGVAVGLTLGAALGTLKKRGRE